MSYASWVSQEHSAPAVDSYPAGTVLAGKYQVEGTLGRGAMGTVVAATHLGLREPRALKLLHSTWLTHPEKVERFRLEARAASKLRGSHVARIYDVGELSSGVPFIVMERLEGVDLESLLEVRGKLEVTEAVTFIRQACEALEEAHGLGIVHRDLKPANLFAQRTPAGAQIKVLDFGVAKIRIVGQTISNTKNGEFIGTPRTMSPEQARGGASVDLRTDIWALGATLYQLLTGTTAFEGKTLGELTHNILFASPRPIRQRRADLPEALEAVILRCLEKSPELRFGSAAELALALAPFASLVATQVTSPTPPSRPGLGLGPQLLIALGALLGVTTGTALSALKARGGQISQASEPLAQERISTQAIDPTSSARVDTPASSSAAPKGNKTATPPPGAVVPPTPARSLKGVEASPPKPAPSAAKDAFGDSRL
jgi:serine/threonine protein kinase